uniref:Caveolae-associated protein 2-like n=1 Tax=Acanthochromis polyacanthus TaxID=80966 RepID=A0A3Q1EUB0_9TELE
ASVHWTIDCRSSTYLPIESYAGRGPPVIDGPRPPDLHLTGHLSKRVAQGQPTLLAVQSKTTVSRLAPGRRRRKRRTRKRRGRRRRSTRRRLGHQVEMEGVVRGIQADMTKLSKSHSHTSNTVSKLLDKSRKLSVTMKEVSERTTSQSGVQVKKLEANHAHLIARNNFKVLIFQEENEIPSTVFVKDPPPFPRDEILEEREESLDRNSSTGCGLQTIDLSSDEDVGLEAELEEEEVWPHDLENMEKSRAEKLKRSSLKKVDSLKKAFSRQNIEKKMTKIGTKIVSAEQREKIKQKTSSLKVSPLSFSIRKVPRSFLSIISLEPESTHLSDLDVPFTEVHAQLAPAEHQEEELREEVEEEEGKEEVEVKEEVEEVEVKEEVEEVEVKEEVEEEVPVVLEADVSVASEGVPEQYALSSTLPQEEKEDES